MTVRRTEQEPSWRLSICSEHRGHDGPAAVAGGTRGARPSAYQQGVGDKLWPLHTVTYD